MCDERDKLKKRLASIRELMAERDSIAETIYEEIESLENKIMQLNLEIDYIDADLNALACVHNAIIRNNIKILADEEQI